MMVLHSTHGNRSVN